MAARVLDKHVVGTGALADVVPCAEISSLAGGLATGGGWDASVVQSRSVKRTLEPSGDPPAVHEAVGKCADAEFLRSKLRSKPKAILAAVPAAFAENSEASAVSGVTEPLASTTAPGQVLVRGLQIAVGTPRRMPIRGAPTSLLV